MIGGSYLRSKPCECNVDLLYNILISLKEILAHPNIFQKGTFFQIVIALDLPFPFQCESRWLEFNLKKTVQKIDRERRVFLKMKKMFSSRELNVVNILKSCLLPLITSNRLVWFI
jgi:hypothetical protein